MHSIAKKLALVLFLQCFGGDWLKLQKERRVLWYDKWRFLGGNVCKNDCAGRETLGMIYHSNNFLDCRVRGLGFKKIQKWP